MTKRDVQLKYLGLIKAGLRKLSDEYFAIPISHLSQKEQYKVVEKYQEKVDRFLDKMNRQGFAEIAAL